MKKFKIINSPIPVSELSLEEFYDDETTESDLKAERREARRLRQFKHQLV